MRTEEDSVEDDLVSIKKNDSIPGFIPVGSGAASGTYLYEAWPAVTNFATSVSIVHDAAIVEKMCDGLNLDSFCESIFIIAVAIICDFSSSRKPSFTVQGYEYKTKNKTKPTMSSDSYKSKSRYGSGGNNRTRQSPPKKTGNRIQCSLGRSVDGT